MVTKEGKRCIEDCCIICTPSELPYIISSIPGTFKDLVVQLCMEGGAIVGIATLHPTYDVRVGAHIYPDKVGLLLSATIESDGAVNEVGAMVVVKANGQQSVSSRCC